MGYWTRKEERRQFFENYTRNEIKKRKGWNISNKRTLTMKIQMRADKKSNQPNL